MQQPSSVPFLFSLFRAVRRARWPILSIAAVYFIGVLTGIVMVHTGIRFALDRRDKIVNDTNSSSSVSQAVQRGSNLEAALRDFAGNLFVGATPETVMGFGIVFPYPWVAYQGWVGGIVSVRGDHSSRFNDPRPAFYYLFTVVMQLIPYSMAVGGGVNVGISLFRPAEYYQGKKWLRLIPIEALKDLLRIYVLVAPLFLIASLWEFLSRWNF